ncbi:hypothetical protein LTR17_005615 [Elasticomyces elasticus]|nr:hypothetical protein LTR17_005615 [Elasticomyces elasticus]
MHSQLRVLYDRIFLVNVVSVDNAGDRRTEVVAPGLGTVPVSAFLSNGTLVTGKAPSTTQSTLITYRDLYYPSTDLQASFWSTYSSWITYPTPAWHPYNNIAWDGTFPHVSGNVTSCISWGPPPRPASTETTDAEYFKLFELRPSPLPTHPPWPTRTGEIDPLDPYGHYYTFNDAHGGWLYPPDISTLWPNDATLASIYDVCYEGGYVAPATAVQTVTALLATSTAYISSALSESHVAAPIATARPVSISSSGLTPPTSTKPPPVSSFAAAGKTEIQPASIVQSDTTQSLDGSSIAHATTTQAENGGMQDHTATQGDTATQGETGSTASTQASCTNIACYILSVFSTPGSNTLGQSSVASTNAPPSTVSAHNSAVAQGETGTSLPSPSSNVVGPEAALSFGAANPAVISETASTQSVSAIGASAIFPTSGTAIPENSFATTLNSVASMTALSTNTLGPGSTEPSSASDVGLFSDVTAAESESTAPVFIESSGAATGSNAQSLSSGSVIVSSPVALIFGSQTLVPGSSIIYSGTTYSLPATGSEILVDGKPTPLPAYAAESPFSLNSIMISPVPESATPNSRTNLMLGAQVLSPGSAVVLSGTTYSLPTTGSDIYINGYSTLLPTGAAGSPFTLGSVIVTPVASADSQTSLPIPAVTTGNNVDTSSVQGSTSAPTTGTRTDSPSVLPVSAGVRGLSVAMFSAVFCLLTLWIVAM